MYSASVFAFIQYLMCCVPRSGLKPTETVEKISLPDDETISSERQHQDLLSGLQAGVELRRADTREPINPLELAKLETSKDQVADQIQAFDRYMVPLNSRKK